jgi:hypothetical protein
MDHPRLYQEQPPQFKRSMFPQKGWTGTVTGYLHEASDLTHCILENAKLLARPYSAFVTVNIEEELSVSQHRAIWKSACRKLREAGVVALWVREVNRKNLLHYHLLVKSNTAFATIASALEAGISVRFHHKPEPVKSRRNYAHYVTKAKISEVVNGNLCLDLYAKKRLLFAAGCGLDKHGTIGKFWERPRAALLKPRIEKNKRISAGMKVDGVRDLVEYIFENLGVSKSMALTFAYFADSKKTGELIEDLRRTGELPPPPHLPQIRTRKEHDER